MALLSYESVRDTLKTGDIVLFSGKGGISTAIKWFTRSPWSHVGMVVNSEDLGAIMLLESTTLSNLTGRKGVQLVLLSERVASYDGAIAIRSLKAASIDNKALAEFRREIRDRPYEQSNIELIRSAYDGPLGENHEDLSSLFCSELVAEAYQRMGLFSEERPSNEYTPADFASECMSVLGQLVVIK